MISVAASGDDWLQLYCLRPLAWPMIVLDIHLLCAGIASIIDTDAFNCIQY